ncbi:MAG: glycosyltransferase [Deltaproteobacteria bacterium]|nr:glycosyltransferase [Deltaproteobacteria bacterium]
MKDTILNFSNINTPLISVITTVYNGERFIRQTIDSVLNQTFSNFEYIIVDDGSIDGTVSIIKTIHDPRIRFYEAGRIGRGNVLNLGLHKAKGEYIAIQDADDISHPERLKIQLNIMQETEDNIALGTDVIRISAHQAIDLASLPPVDTIKPKIKNVTNHIIYYNPIRHSSTFIARESILKINGYSEKRKNLFDWEMFIRYVANGGKLYTISEPLIFKRQHKDQFFENKNRRSYIFSGIRLQYKAAINLKGNRLILGFLPLLILYRLLPLELRMLFRNAIGK